MFLVLQKVAHKYPRVGGINYLLMVNPSPTNLYGNSLDCEEKTGITNTEEAVQIDKIFILATNERCNTIGEALPILPPRGGLVRSVIQAGIARTGSTTGNIYLSKIITSLGYVDSDGNFTSESEESDVLNFYTNKTDYQLCSSQVWLDWNFAIPKDCRLALRVGLHGYVETTQSGKMRLYCRRGSYDSYLEF